MGYKPAPTVIWWQVEQIQFKPLWLGKVLVGGVLEEGIEHKILPIPKTFANTYYLDFTSELRFKADPSKGIKSGRGMALETEPYPIDQEKRKFSISSLLLQIDRYC